MRQVKVDLMCPYCGFCQILKVPITISSRVYCPSCKQLVFLRYATGARGEVDEHGNYFKAYEPFKLRAINRAFENVFKEEKTNDECTSI